jgi:cytochrome c oxidase subunit 1
MNPALGMAFGIATTLIALPSGVKVFNWLATLWGARLQLTSALLFALGFVALFISGGLSGLWLACTPVDVYMHDTYFVVAHFHFIVFGGSVFGLFAACYHWFPKMFGRMLDERLGRLHFVGTFVLTVGVFLLMHQLGLAGMPRRIADPTVYPSLRHLVPLNVTITICALLLAAWRAARARRATPGARPRWNGKRTRRRRTATSSASRKSSAGPTNTIRAGAGRTSGRRPLHSPPVHE